MKKLLMAVAAICLMASVGYAYEMTYGWEDCGTVLAIYPSTDMFCTNVTTTVHSGFRALECVDNSPGTTTPQAYVAYVYGLADGDSVYCSFWRYDTTPAASPSCRIWAHWNDSYPPDIMGYNGSASGNTDYGPGLGWDKTSWYWKVSAGHFGIVIEVRTYSNYPHTVWVDDLYVYAPSRIGVCIHVPEPGPSAVEPSTWGSIKGLYR